MSDPTRYPVRYTPVIRTVSRVGLGTPYVSAYLVGSNFGTVVRPVYVVQAYYDGTGYWANTAATVTTTGAASPAIWSVTWGPVAGATHYRIFRYPYGDTSKTLQIYAGDGRGIIHPNTLKSLDNTFIDQIDGPSDFVTRGRTGASIAKTANADVERLIDLRPAEAQKNPTLVPIVNIGPRRFVDQSGRPIENRNLELIRKTRGFRRVFPVTAVAPIGTTAANSILELFGSAAAFIDGPTSPGLEMHLTLNAGDGTLPAYSRLLPNALTEWREVFMTGGDLSIGGFQDGNSVLAATFELWDTKTVDSMFPEMTPDSGRGMW